MIVAIHQPNFFPWLGYFRKIARADTFVFLDGVAFSKGSWTNRVRMLVAGEARWVTCPIFHELGQPIHDVRIEDSQPWRKKLCKTFDANYRKAPHFAAVMAWVEPMIHRPCGMLAEYNRANIRQIASQLGLQTRFAVQSELSAPAIAEATGSERLVAICRELGGRTYLAGDGADGYEDAAAYEAGDIRTVKMGFRLSSYPQVGTKVFVGGLSILDAIFNLGLDRTRAMLL